MSQRRGNLLHSFNWAFDGIVHALRYERNMWIHFALAGLVLVACLFFALTRLEVIAVLVKNGVWAIPTTHPATVLPDVPVPMTSSSPTAAAPPYQHQMSQPPEYTGTESVRTELSMSGCP